MKCAEVIPIYRSKTMITVPSAYHHKVVSLF